MCVCVCVFVFVCMHVDVGMDMDVCVCVCVCMQKGTYSQNFYCKNRYSAQSWTHTWRRLHHGIQVLTSSAKEAVQAH
jgi:hypothetical protein